MMDQDTQEQFSAEDLAQVQGEAADKGADAGGDKGGKPSDQAADDATPAKAGDGKSGDAKAGDGKAGDDKGAGGKDAKSDADKGADKGDAKAGKADAGDSLLGDDEDDEDADDDADGADDKEVGKDGNKDKGDGKATWADRRESIAKAAEDKWLKKAKTDEEKKAVATRLGNLKKTLARYGSEEAYLLANLEAQEQLRNTRRADKPGKDATPEEIAAYREAQGLPKAPEDISIPRVEITDAAGRKVNIEWTEEHKPLHDSFRQVAFALDLNQAQADQLVRWQVAAAEEAKAAQIDKIKAIDKEDKRETRAVLKEEFGEELHARLEVIDRLLKDDDALPEGAGRMLFEARTPDGRALKHHPVILKLLSDIALNGWGEFGGYGEGSLISGGDAKAEVVTSRIEELAKIRDTDIQRFRREKNGNGQTLAEEMLELQRKADARKKGRRAA